MKVDPETLALIVALSQKEVVNNTRVIEGKPGKPGKDGATGPRGNDGKPGRDGVSIRGDKGEPGRDGKDGINGINGIDGKQGPRGRDGRLGRDGKNGLPGKDGTGVKSALVDNRGHLIVVLTNGDRLDAGLVRGEKGEKGDRGERGRRGSGGGGLVQIGGSEGPQGPAGPQGPVGPQGPAGADGTDAEFPDGASEGQVLTADAQGDPVWADAASGVSEPTIPAFTDLTDQAAGDVIESAAVTVTGDADTVWPVTVRGDGSPQVEVAGQEWGVSGNVRNGDQIRLRLTAAVTAQTARSATLYFQGGSQDWSVATQDVPWTPADAANLVLWLDADDTDTLTLSGSSVTAWADKSPANTDATAPSGAEPTYNATGLNSLPTVVTTGPQRLTHSSILTSNYSAFYVIREDNTATVGYFHTGNVSANSDLAFWSGFQANGWGIFVRPNITAQTSASQNTGPAVVGFVTGTVFEDGAEVAYQSQDANVGGGLTTIGAREDQVNLNMTGAISEIVIYERTVTESERQLVEGYLAHKWGLEGSLPADHPYKASAP